MKSKMNNPNVNWDGMLDQQNELVNLMAVVNVDEKLLKKVTCIQCPELSAKKFEDSPAYAEAQEDLVWEGFGCIDLNKPRQKSYPHNERSPMYRPGGHLKGSPCSAFKSPNKKEGPEIEPQKTEVYNFRHVTPEEHETILENLKKFSGNNLRQVEYEKSADIPTPVDIKKLLEETNRDIEPFYQVLLDDLHEHYPKLKFTWNDHGELEVSWEFGILSLDTATTNVSIYTLQSVRERFELITDDQDIIRKGLEAVIEAEFDKIFG